MLLPRQTSFTVLSGLFTTLMFVANMRIGSSRRIQNMGFIGGDIKNGIWMTLNGGALLTTGKIIKYLSCIKYHTTPIIKLPSQSIPFTFTQNPTLI